jgi:diacylglycerol kinase family enzyme
VLLDIDGEALGSLPARMDVMPNALRVIGAAE